MNKKITIERAGRDDVCDIMEIMGMAQKLVKDGGWYAADTEEFVAHHVEDEGFILKAVMDEKTVGFLIIRYPNEAKDNLGVYRCLSEKEKSQVAHMESAAVRPESKGLGIQRRLMQYGENLLKGSGYRYLMGTAHPENVFSVNNFLKLEYEIVAEDKKYGGLPRYVFYKEI